MSSHNGELGCILWGRVLSCFLDVLFYILHQHFLFESVLVPTDDLSGGLSRMCDLGWFCGLLLYLANLMVHSQACRYVKGLLQSVSKVLSHRYWSTLGSTFVTILS